MKLLGVPLKPRQVEYLLGDLVCTLLAIWLGHALRYGPGSADARMLTILADHPGIVVYFAASSLLFLYLADSYNTAFDFRRAAPNVRLWSGVVAAVAAEILVYTVFPAGWWGRGVAGLVSLSQAFLLTTWRALLCRFLPPPIAKVKTVIVGAGKAGHLIADVIREQHEFDRGYSILGFIEDKRFGNRRRSDHVDDDSVATDYSPPVLGPAKDLPELVDRHDVDLIVVALRGNGTDDLVRALLECKAKGVRIEHMPSLYKRLMGKVPVLHMPESWVVFSPVFSERQPLAAGLERIVDILVALVGLLLSAPLIAVSALAIRLESPGSPFFVQERLGINEKPFPMVKLRTMRQDAEAGTGAVWSGGKGDPRVTRVGRFLRRTRIDELPQFYNVLVGHMAVVGPRPERDHFVRMLKEQVPFYSLRFAVRPGLTGWAQVMYRYGASVDDAVEKLCYELYAIQDLTPVLYVVILIKTVRTVLLRPGS